MLNTNRRRLMILLAVVLTLYHQVTITSSQFLCGCDRQRGLCETDCCCDQDCPSTELFSRCQDSPRVDDSTLCSYQQVLYDPTTNQAVVTQVSNPNFFCVQTPNVDRSSYLPVDCAGDSTCLNTAPRYSYIDGTSTTAASSAASYAVGDPIAVEYSNDAAGSLSLPSSSGSSGFCQEPGSVASFLRSSVATCSRTAASLTELCVNTPGTQAQTYLNFVLFPFKLTPSEECLSGL